MFPFNDSWISCLAHASRVENPSRSQAVARAIAPRAAALVARAFNMTKSWMVPWNRTAVTRTAASQFVGIRLPFVAQHVRFGGDDECWRKSFQLLGARPQRRGGDLVTLARVTCVLIPEPHHGI